MQLIDTDTDIVVQTKMSTMQQESLEKFSIIESVCSDITDITNGNEECVKKQEVVQVCQKNTDEDEQNAQHTVTRPLLTDKRNEKYDDTKKKCDKESVENKENSEFEDSYIIRIENDETVQVQTNDEVSIPSGEVILDTEMKNVDKLTSNSKNESEINKTKKESHPNYEMAQDTIVGQVKMDRNMTEVVEVDITFEEDAKVNNSLNEDKIEIDVVEKMEVVDTIEKQNEEDIEVDVTFEKPGADNNSVPENNTEKVKDKLEELNEETVKRDGLGTRETENNSKIEDIIQKRNEDIEMNAIYEEGKLNTNEDKIEDEIKDKRKKDDKIQIQNEEDIEVDVIFEKPGADNNSVPGNNTEKVKDKLEKLNEETVKCDGLCTRGTENNSKIENIIKKGNEDIEMNAINEEGKLNTNEDKVENEIKDKRKKDDTIQIQNEEDIAMDVTFEEDNRLNKISKEYEIEDENKKQSEMDENIEKQKKEDIERGVTLEKQDEVINCVTVTTKDIRQKELPTKNSEKELFFPELQDIEKQDCEKNMECKDKMEEQVKKTNETEDNQNMMDVTEEDKVSSVTEVKIEHDARPSCEIKEELKELPREETENENVPERLKDIQVQNNVKRELIEEEVKETSAMDVNENQYEEYSEIEISSEGKNSATNTNNTMKKGHSNIDVKLRKLNNEKIGRDDLLGTLKEINKLDKLKEHDIDRVKGDSSGEQVEENSEVPSKLQELITEKDMVLEELDEKSKPNSVTLCSIGDQAKKEIKIEDKFLEKNENKVQKPSVQDVEENLMEGNNVKRDHKYSQNENKIIKEITVQKSKVSETNDAEKDSESSNKCKMKQENNEQQEEKDSDSSNDIAKKSDHFEKIQEVAIGETQPIQGIVNITNSDCDEVVTVKPELRDIKEENNTDKCISNSETGVTEMDTDEIIDIADEKDDDIDIDQGMNDTDKESSVNIENINVSKQKTDSILIKTDSDDTLSREKSATESLIQDTNDQQKKVKKSRIDIVEEKKKLTHISKLSNTLDILSDEEDDLLNDEPQKNVSGYDEKQCTSINIDDDDDIMLIDDEPKCKVDKNKPESLPEPESEVDSKKDIKIEIKEEQFQEISESKKDQVSEPEQEGTPIQKKPLVQLNFLKSCIKNLGDMTRDELEEFCILKIVESVVDRSNLSEIKSQLKTMAQNIEEYKKKASILVKQNRDLQVVIKSVQEEQKKKSNMPITPLKITRSVGMQVLMTDKIAVRKKIQNLNQNNAAPNSGGTNRQGKAAQNPTKLQKMLTGTNNSPPIPVPRLVPAGNSNNSNNVKTQSPSTNTSGKSQATGSITNSPMQTVSNGLPATPPAPKTEKRPHSRMQQGNNSFTVDLTDDEPPTKVGSRNVTPPVRLVPPQNLLAPNRQPFGANANTPRKVYIPIGGQQTPIGVRPGQTIVLKTILPQCPKQRVPNIVKTKGKEMTPSAIRMQRSTFKHPAPLPEAVKQYQPLNWKALPPIPELKLSKVENGIVISWKIDRYLEENYEEIASYQLYAYQETPGPPSTSLWKKIGDVKALPLPMACTLTQFLAGYKYFFAVRAVDIRSRLGPFSLPGSILLMNDM